LPGSACSVPESSVGPVAPRKSGNLVMSRKIATEVPSGGAGMAAQALPHHEQCSLDGPGANLGTAPEEDRPPGISLSQPGDRHAHRAYRLLEGSPARSGDTRDSDAHIHGQARAHTLGHGLRHLLAHRTVPFQQLLRHTELPDLHTVVVR